MRDRGREYAVVFEAVSGDTKERTHQVLDAELDGIAVRTLDSAEVDTLLDASPVDGVILARGQDGESNTVTALDRIAAAVPTMIISTENDECPAGVRCVTVNRSAIPDAILEGVVAFEAERATDRALETSDRIKELQTFARTLTTVSDEQTIYDRAVAAAEDILAFEVCVIGAFDHDDGVFSHRATAGEIGDDGPSISIDELESRSYESRALQAYKGGETVVDHNADGPEHPSLITVPLAEIGILQVGDSTPGAFSDTDIALAEILGSHITQAVTRLRSERALRAEWRKFAALFEKITDPLVELRIDGDDAIIEDANAAFVDLFDVDREAIEGQSLPDVIRPLEARAPWRSADDTIQLDTPDGPRTFRVATADVDDASIGRRFAGFTDITEQRHLTMRLRERSEKIHQLHHFAAEVASCTTRSDIYALTIAALEEILEFDVCTIDILEDDQLVQVATGSGVLPEETRQETPIDRPDSVAVDTLNEATSIVIDDSKTDLAYDIPGPYRSVLSTPIGRFGVLQIGAREPGAFTDADVELLELLVAHVREGLKWIESESALRTERDKFASLFENIADPAIEARFDDGRSIIESVNPAFETVFGYHEDTAVGTPLNELIVPPEAAEESAAISDKIAAGEPVETEVTRVTDTGDSREFLLRSVPFDLEGQRVTHYFIYTDITEQKHLERQLRERSERIQRLLEVATELSRLETEDELYVAVIDAAESVLAFDIAALCLQSGDVLEVQAMSSNVDDSLSFDRIHLDDEEHHPYAIRTYRDRETIAVTDEETLAYPSLLSIPVGDIGVFQAGRADANGFDPLEIELSELFIAHTAETVQRIRSEAAVRNERDKFATLFENVHDPVVEAHFADGEPIIKAVNSAFERTFGFTAAQVIDHPVDMFILPDDRQAEGSEINQRVLAGESVEAEVRRQTADGLRDFLLRTVPYHAGERPRLYAIYVDITAQSERVRKLQQVTSASRAQIDAADTSAIMAVVEATASDVLDADAVEILTWSDQASGLVTADGGTVVPRDDPIIGNAYRARKVRHRAGESVGDTYPWLGSMRSVLAIPIGGSRVVTVAHHDAAAVDDYDRTLASIISAITESALRRTEREEALREREHELALQNERLDKFASIVSHDLRNPLNVAIGHLDLYRETDDDDHLDAVERGHERIRKIIEDVLTLAREGARSVDPYPVDLERVAEEAWTTAVQSDAATLEIDLDPPGPILADRSRLKQILENLFRNAHEHGEADVTVTLHGDATSFCVTDDGDGIDEADRDRIFETGYSTRAKGTGIGLNIVRQLCESHGWAVRAIEPPNGTGACIEITGIQRPDS